MVPTEAREFAKRFAPPEAIDYAPHIASGRTYLNIEGQPESSRHLPTGERREVIEPQTAHPDRD